MLYYSLIAALHEIVGSQPINASKQPKTRPARGGYATFECAKALTFDFPNFMLAWASFPN